MNSLKDIRVVITNGYLVIMDKDMKEILSRTEEPSPKNKVISHHYKGLQFVAMPNGEIYINLSNLQKNQHLLK